jgi:putative DNA primase/helicase
MANINESRNRNNTEARARQNDAPEARALWLIDKLGGDPATGRCFCPAHDDAPSPSFDVSLREFSPKGNPLFKCRAGCEQGAVLSALRARGCWPIPGSVPPSHGGSIRKKRTPEDRRAFARDVWQLLRDKRDDPAWKLSLAEPYFRARGINDVPRTARLAMPIRRRPTRKECLSDDPGIVFRVRDKDNNFMGIHIIWLNGEMTGKREPEPKKQSWGPIKGGFVLLGVIDTDQPLIITEGIEKALAMLQITGLPAALVGCGELTKSMEPPDHPAGYIISVDHGDAGKQLAHTLARRLAADGRVVRLVTPPLPEGKEKYDWDDALVDGVDPAQLKDAILNAPDFDSKGDVPILSNKTPLKSAEEFVKRQFSSDGAVSLLYYRGDFYQWAGTHYEECDEGEMRSLLYDFLDKALTPGGDGFEPFNPDYTKVNRIVDALASGVHEKPKPNAPFWTSLGQYTEDPANLIACRNGLLDLETGKLLAHTPRLFNVNCLPFDYDPKASAYPPMWMQFLRQLWPGDNDGKRARFALQEMFGLMLTPDTRFQKIFAIIGPRRSGKGTIGRVLRALLGKDNVEGPTLASLSTQFGLQPLIHKRAAIIADARLGKGSSVSAIAERLLSISGEDALTIDRKHKTAWTGPLGTRFLILTNELPQIPDAAGALASRFIILMLKRSFYDEEDLELTNKLLTELPGILNWALAGLKRLRKYGYFEMPKSSHDAIRQLENLASPVRAFTRDWCNTTDVDATIKVKALYTAYRCWSGEHGIAVKNSIVFGRDLRAAYPSIKTSGHSDGRYYTKIKLSKHGLKQYEMAKVMARAERKSDDE